MKAFFWCLCSVCATIATAQTNAGYKLIAPALATNCINKTVTFTNLQGQVYSNVQLVRADLDGIIYREPDTAGGGRILYSNLAPALLLSWGIPTNWAIVSGLRTEIKNATVQFDQFRQAVSNMRYSLKQVEREVRNQVNASKENLGFRVIQRVASAALVSFGDKTLYVMDCPPTWVDGDNQAAAVYPIGTYEYTTVTGALKTVRRYTCSVEHAVSAAPELQKLRDLILLKFAAREDITINANDLATFQSIDAFLVRTANQLLNGPASAR